MKRLIIGLFAAVVALAGSAYTNASKKVNLPGTYYIFTPEGDYVRTAITPNTLENCGGQSAYECWIQYEQDQGERFSPSNLPNAPIIDDSQLNGVYNP